jgi:hypothetical protein
MIDSMLEEKPIGFAQRGDLVLVPARGLESSGNLHGRFRAVHRDRRRD